MVVRQAINLTISVTHQIEKKVISLVKAAHLMNLEESSYRILLEEVINQEIEKALSNKTFR